MVTPPHPSIARIASVARALRELSVDVVFIGGAIAPLLQTTPVLPRVRPTEDVDAIMASTSYNDYSATESRIRELGFGSDLTDSSHAHRWISPDGIIFDIVPLGDHLTSAGGEWDQLALDTAVTSEIERGLNIRHASGPGFLALKWAAFWDRGVDDPFRSSDLEDILALIASRHEILDEFSASAPAVQERIKVGLQWLEQHEEYDDFLAAYLGHAPGYNYVAELVRERLRVMLEFH